MTFGYPHVMGPHWEDPSGVGKGAVAAMTKNLGRNHVKDNIKVNAICPNEVDTPC